ncbi:MAG: T9SS type A sorting domain-containing protein [Candidatus Zixiibacteriota bacterium]
MTWSEDTLWLADVFTGVFYKTFETNSGLEIIDSLQVPRDPFMQARDLTWDGENLWSINWGDLLRHDMTDTLLSPDLWITEEALHHMKAIAWDGTHLWSALDGNLYKHSSSDYSVIQTIEILAQPTAMSFHDDGLWLVGRDGGFIYKLDRNTFVELARYNLVPDPLGLAWSNTNLWLYSWSDNRIYKITSLPLPDISLDPEDDFLTEGEDYTIPGSIDPDSGDVTWTFDESPYLVNGISVPSGVTLTIEPGVKVYITDVMTVEGVLQATGKADSMIVFTHANPNETWGGLEFMGEESSRSVLEYVKIQYGDNGINCQNSVPRRIRNSIIRRSRINAIRYQLETGSYDTLDIVGNRIEQAAAMAVEINVLSSSVSLSSILFKGNTVKSFYGAGFKVESPGWAAQPPAVIVEHNIFENGYRGVGGGFPGVGNVIYRHNMNVQPFYDGNIITYNYIADTFEGAYQLHPGHFVTNTVFEYNTVRWGSFDHDWGDPTIVVEYNNLIPAPFWEWWAEGIAGIDGGYDVAMRNNWWGTADVGEIKAHILDKEDQDDRGYVFIEPILTAPNGVGFIRGKFVQTEPVTGIQVIVDSITVFSNAAGEFFLAAREGTQELQITYPNGSHYTYNTVVTSGEVTFLELSSAVLTVDDNTKVPRSFTLYQNYPNPFNPITTIRYSLPFGTHVKLVVYNILGQKVTVLVDAHQPSGNHEVKWDATNLSSGVYFYKIVINGQLSAVKKAIYMK